MVPNRWSELVNAYELMEIEFPQLKAVSLAMWWLESAKGESELAKVHYNFGGLKYRPEMKNHASAVQYSASDGVDTYCRFLSLEDFIKGFWFFLDRAPYVGWREKAHDPVEFIKFIGKTYSTNPKYAELVTALIAEPTPAPKPTPVPTPAPKPAPSPLGSFLRLTPTDKRYPTGHIMFKLALVRYGDWVELDHVFLKSGAAGRQQLELGKVAIPQSYKPIPEGYYRMSGPEWKAGVGNWNASWGKGLGPLWFRINKIDPKQTARDDFGIHLDPEADGTAGCIGAQDRATLEKILTWDVAGKVLTVNHGLKSVETKPTALTYNPQMYPVVTPVAPVPGTPPDSPFRVMLEIGHGPNEDGYEEGAYNAFLKRSEYNTTKNYIGPQVEAILKSAGVEVTMNDYKDTLTAIGKRGAGYNAFVSLHLNAFNDDAQGSETLVLGGARASDNRLANYIQKNVVRTMKIANRGVKNQGLSVLRGASSAYLSNPPDAACLVEPFFIDAVRDTATLNRYIENASRGIAEGILDFLGIGQDPEIV